MPHESVFGQVQPILDILVVAICCTCVSAFRCNKLNHEPVSRQIRRGNTAVQHIARQPESFSGGHLEVVSVDFGADRVRRHQSGWKDDGGHAVGAVRCHIRPIVNVR